MHRFLKSFIWFVVLALLVVVAARQSRSLARFRRVNMPEVYMGGKSAPPPALTFVMAGLGGFRGVVAEVLWFRVHRLQEEGRYMELVQLSDWLTMLDPHASEAWVYNAWNLTYNISIMMNRPEDRLRWVESGISLLRDEGLRFNPRDARLYRELSWFYLNKIGDALDEAHLTYKLKLATVMAPCVNDDGTVRLEGDNRERLAALRLDAERMAELERRFGALDWRMPQTHAIYWASQGVEFAKGNECLLSSRMLYQSLIQAVFNGRFTGDLSESKWQSAPNPSLALTTADFLAVADKEFGTQTIKTIRTRFLLTTIRLLHDPLSGDNFYAAGLLRRLKEDLGAAAQHLTVNDIVKGWTPDENRN